MHFGFLCSMAGSLGVVVLLLCHRLLPETDIDPIDQRQNRGPHKKMAFTPPAKCPLTVSFLVGRFGSPCYNRLQKKVGTLLLTSLLKDLVAKFEWVVLTGFVGFILRMDAKSISHIETMGTIVGIRSESLSGFFGAKWVWSIHTVDGCEIHVAAPKKPWFLTIPP